MSWAVEYDPVTKIIAVVYTGRVTSEELKDAAAERIRLQKQHGTHLVLTNASGLEHFAAGVLDVHDLPARLYDRKQTGQLISRCSQRAQKKDGKPHAITKLHVSTAVGMFRYLKSVKMPLNGCWR